MDNGSSTFDITVIGRKGLFDGKTGEDSCPFGGNHLDENLLKIMQDALKEQNFKLSVNSLPLKLELRRYKEAYYGNDGTGKHKKIYSMEVVLHNGDIGFFSFPIDKNSMKMALEKVPDKKNKKSWIENCTDVYESFYQKMLPLFTKEGSDIEHSKVPNRVILSGGASVMPEVKLIAEKVFGQTPKLTFFPNYTVSKGLAYILGCEVLKFQYLNDLLKTLDEQIVPSADSLRKEIVSAGVAEDWQVFETAITNWADAEEDQSIQDFHTFHEEVFDHNLNPPVQNGSKNWYENNNLQTKINKMLQDKFESMFPNFVYDFDYNLPPMTFESLKGVIVTIIRYLVFFFGWMTANEDGELVLTRESFLRKRNRVWRCEAKNRFLNLKESIINGDTRTIYYDGRGLIGGIHDWFFGRNGTAVSYKGLEKMYRDEFTDAVVIGIRKEILDLLKDRMKEHVERITPYFNMSAKFDTEN